MDDSFRLGKQRRRIEDSLVQRFQQIPFQHKHYAYLDDERVWDFVFSWYELVQYYETSGDNTLGAPLLALFTECSARFRMAASDARLPERRRDKAADALYQITYQMNQIALQVQRNGLEQTDNLNSLDRSRDSDTSSYN